MIRSIEWKTTSWLFSNIPKQVGYLQYSLIPLFLPPPAPLPHPAFVSVCIIQSLPQWLWGAPERSRLLLDKARHISGDTLSEGHAVTWPCFQSHSFLSF